MNESMNEWMNKWMNGFIFVKYIHFMQYIYWLYWLRCQFCFGILLFEHFVTWADECVAKPLAIEPVSQMCLKLYYTCFSVFLLICLIPDYFKLLENSQFSKLTSVIIFSFLYPLSILKFCFLNKVRDIVRLTISNIAQNITEHTT